MNSPESREDILNRLKECKDSKDLSGCILLASQLVELEPNNALPRIELGRAFWHAGFLMLAKEHLEVAYRLSPGTESLIRLIRQIDPYWNPPGDEKEKEGEGEKKVVASTELDLDDL